jgi:Ser/Thr protein kinase RdoA (MazF antagonist)
MTIDGKQPCVLDRLVKEATLCYFQSDSNAPSIDFEVRPTSHGSNNWVYYVDVNGECFVLRLYNNGNSLIKVKAEHAILEALTEVHGLPFSTPQLIHAAVPSHSERGNGGRKDAQKSTFVELSNGSHACFFRFLPGEYVGGKSAFMPSMGRATSELMAVLQELYTQSSSAHDDKTITSPTMLSLRDTHEHGPAPYWDLWRVHASISGKEAFLAYCEHSPDLAPFAADMQTLLSAISDMEAQISAWHASGDGDGGFPLSFVHGDLVTDNFLCRTTEESHDSDEGRENAHTHDVTAVLDFEFVGCDWRAMELATCISKFPEEEQPMRNLGLFAQGFRQAGKVQLTAAEVQALPALIRLRVLSNVVYFVGRAMAGEAAISALTDRIGGYCRRLLWLGHEGNQSRLRALFD